MSPSKGTPQRSAYRIEDSPLHFAGAPRGKARTTLVQVRGESVENQPTGSQPDLNGAALCVRGYIDLHDPVDCGATCVVRTTHSAWTHTVNPCRAASTAGAATP